MKSDSNINEFTKVYCCSLIESHDRRSHLKSQFSNHNINSFFILLSERFENSTDKIKGEYLYFLDDGTKGAIVSHLKNIKKWYDESDEPYGFFCEDDISFDTVQYWNFTWNEFIENLPQNWDCIQLVCCGPHLDEIKFRRRYWDDFSVGAYIISRKYAKVLIESYIEDDQYILEYPEKDNWAPLAENLIYFSPKTALNINDSEMKYNVYTFPLFVEDIKFNTTFLGRNTKDLGKDCGIYDQSHKEYHTESYYKVINWWESVGKNLTIQQIMDL